MSQDAPMPPAEIPGSLVSEPKHRDSRFKSWLGIGIEIQFWEVSESVSEPKLRFQVSESEPESKIPPSWSQNRNRYVVQVKFSLNYKPFLLKKSLFYSQ